MSGPPHAYFQVLHPPCPIPLWTPEEGSKQDTAKVGHSEEIITFLNLGKKKNLKFMM